MPAYSKLDKLLHRLALQLGPVAELSFDLDQRLAGVDYETVAGEQHVFVSGLARAGTTALMRRLYASGAFRSLTYRDMPFVLAPNLWRKLTAGGKRDIMKGERAHGDRILIDVDSPESFDEVFWRIFAGEEYLGKAQLTPHRPDPEIIEKYVRFVGAVLAAQDEKRTRYLSKNNNNVLRLETIRAAFTHALIIIPVRDPMAQAASLLRQHRLFTSLQREDPFAQAYMTWLGHHEFGLDHRPFRFGNRTRGDEGVPEEPSSINYWLGIWAETYEWLERTAPVDVHFVVYEELCSDPTVWERLAGLVGIDSLAGADEPFQSSNRKPEKSASADALPDPALVNRSMAVYKRLAQRAKGTLC